MKVVIWIFLFVLILSFAFVLVQQITNRATLDQKYELCRVDAEALRAYEWTWSWAPFSLLYWLLCRVRSRSLGPLERLVLSVFLTIGLFGFVFWAWMSSVFHANPDCAAAPLPFGTFLSAWTSPLGGIAIVIAVGLAWNYTRVGRVAPKEV